MPKDGRVLDDNKFPAVLLGSPAVLLGSPVVLLRSSPKLLALLLSF